MLDGYRADCTRTVALGRPDPALAEVHEVVVRAQRSGREAAVCGALAGDVDRAARAVVEEAGYGAAFVHGTGHGVGLEVHEAPMVAPGARATLPAGAVLTVEPGIYLPDVGGVRIEDTLVVAPDGPPQPLTDIPRDLLVLDTIQIP
jgi:Xaa-Pro aminopeptidase